MHKIILIDDNLTQYYKVIDSLKEKYIVITTEYIEPAIYLIEKHSDCKLIILDIVMPSQKYTEEDTCEGTTTGIIFYERELKLTNIPVLFWSINHNSESLIKDKGFNNVYFKKKSNDENHLLDEVDKIINKHNEITVPAKIGVIKSIYSILKRRRKNKK